MYMCTKYGESGCKDANRNRWVPRKVSRDFPLIPRLNRIFLQAEQTEDSHGTKMKQVTIL
jgi:hypothetical protein